MGAVLWLKFKKMRDDVAMYVIMLVMALVLTFVFSGAIFGEYNTQRVYAINNDNSEVTEQFLSNIDENSFAIEFSELDEAETAVAKGDTLAAIVIPEGFGNALKQGDAELELIKSADSTDIMALKNVLQAAANKTAHVYALTDSLGDTLSVAGVNAPALSEVQTMYEQRMGENAVAQVEYSVHGADRYDEKFASDVHYLMGYNIFFVMFSVIFTIATILEDKKLGTWNRIRITPLKDRAILGGNMIPTFLVGVAQMAIMLFGGQFLFGIDLGSSIWPVFVVFVVYALTVTCLGLLLATMFATYEQLNAAAPVIIVASSMLGGCMWPLSIVPPALQTAAKFTPQYWALEAAEDLPVLGGGFPEAAASIYVLLGMTVLFFALSMVFYNKKQRA